jgi:predicted ATP-dependent serine protease
MTGPLPPIVALERPLGPGFELMPNGVILVGGAAAAGKTCLSLNLVVQYAANLGEQVFYISTSNPKEVLYTRLAKNMAPEGMAVNPDSVAKLPLSIVEGDGIPTDKLTEGVENMLAKHGSPGLVIINDLQGLVPSVPDLKGLASAEAVLADLRALAKICEAPVVVLSQLNPEKSVSSRILDQVDRVVILELGPENPTHRRIVAKYFDPPEPEADQYKISLTRESGVMQAFR